MKWLLLLFFITSAFAATTTLKSDKLKLGRDTGEDIYIFADTGAVSLPYLFYDFSEGVWKQSNDGVSSEVIGGASVITTQGDLILGDVSGDDSRLPIGTSGQVLTSNGTTASWQAPVFSSPTTTEGDLILRGAAVDERLPIGTSDQVLTSNGTTALWQDLPPGAPTTTKGDLSTYSTAQDRLAVGNDGEFLVADSAESTGLKWSDQLQGVLNPVSDWDNYTASGSWTTNSTYTGKYRLVGDTLNVSVRVDTTGAPDATNLTFNLPSGYTIDTSKLASNTNGLSGLLGYGNGFNGSAVHSLVILKDTDTSVRVGYQSNTSGAISLVTQAAPFTVDSGDFFDMTFQVPVLEASSGTDAVVRNKVLRKVRARKTTAQTIPDNVATTVVFDEELEDNANLYNNSTGVFTCPEAGAKFRIGSTIYLENIDDNSDSIALTNIINSSGETYEIWRKRGFKLSEFNATSPSSPFDFECASAGQTWEVRGYCQNIDNTTCSTRASGAGNYYNHLSITELADSHVIAGTFGKCQKKFLSANSGAVTDVSDLRFNNLTIGQKYSLKLHTRINNGSGANDVVYFDMYNSGTFLVNNIVTVLNGLESKSEIDFRFTATGTQTRIDFVSVATGEDIIGNGSSSGTYAELCTDNREETTEWN